MTDPVDVVERFCAAFEEKDLTTLGALLDENVRKQTIGAEPTFGRDVVLVSLSSLFTCFDRIDFRIASIAACGGIVLTERVDEFVTADVVAPIPVMGTFEVHDGCIVGWRDYCDLSLSTRLMAGEQVDSLLPG